MFRTTVIDQISIATEVANPEEKNADHLLPPLYGPTEYYQFKRCQVPVGHPVYSYNKSQQDALFLRIICSILTSQAGSQLN